MDWSTGLLLGTVTLMVANRALHVGARWHERRGLFWTVQLLNFSLACLLVTVGIPGFSGILRIVNLMLAGLLILHTVQNNRRYGEAWRELGPAVDDDLEARRAQVLARMTPTPQDGPETEEG